MVLSALYAVFLAAFALDAFDPVKSRWAQWLTFGGHLLPSAFILLVLILAWPRGVGLLFLWSW